MTSNRKWSMGAVSLVAVVVSILLCGILVFFHSNYDWRSLAGSSSQQKSGTIFVKEGNQTSTWPMHGNTIYGHVHMAKTAGTEINGVLAAKFERVCGHKGYSYDAYNLNLRAKEWKETHPKQQLTEKILKDSVSKATEMKGYNRGRVPVPVMDEIGYEDCDWISHETGFKVWPKLAKQFSSFEFEIHVPCRDPIDWLMSMFNHKRVSFSCDQNSTIQEKLKNGLMETGRFDDTNWKSLPRNMHFKCFNPIPAQPYLNHMEKILQPKRVASTYIHRDTNRKRNKKAECIHTHEDLKAEVEKYLVENVAIFRFCNKCMGSKDDLLLM